MLAQPATTRQKPPPVHNFASCKAFATEFEDDWKSFYEDYFRDFGVVAVNSIPGGSNVWQKQGVDRVIYLANGDRVTVDEKIRTKDYGDCLLEIFSVYRKKASPSNRVGWAADETKRCDYVAYAVLDPEFRVVRMLPRLQLVRAVKRNLDDWKRGTGGVEYPKRARNKRYESRSAAVPWSELDRAIAEVQPEPAPF